jgi:2-polyprenyl-3-methyl-5-hydroxy-6-metoxy-1,4-benzoquinol methylase
MATEEPDRTRARQLAKDSVAAGDPTGWFEQLYKESEDGATVVPWADMRPNPNLTTWWDSRPDVTLGGRTALVVGCGFGDDAEQLAAWGAAVTAFDIAPTAIVTARRRFPETKVGYQTADLLNPPASCTRRFDFVFESYTLQALPSGVRAQAIERVASFVASKGHLLIVARGRDREDPEGEMPWSLLKEELAAFEHLGLELARWEDYLDDTTRRFRVLYFRR